MRFHSAAWFLVVTLAVFSHVRAQESPRRTASVRVVEKCLPSVVAIHSLHRDPETDEKWTSFGSGVILHESGFVLTNHHVVDQSVDGIVVLHDDQMTRYVVLASFAHEDLAILRVASGDGSLKPIALGRSDDLMLGEPAISIGSPGGIARSISTGVVSGLNRSTRSADGFFPWMIQTSAGSGQGMSGGPVVNALGEMIGLLTTGVDDVRDINFAISVDHVRKTIPSLLAVEERWGIRTGLRVDTLASAAVVTAVEENSPADLAGLLPGDTVLEIDRQPIRTGVDCSLLFAERKPGDVLPISYSRQGIVELTKLTLLLKPPVAGVTVNAPERGLRFEVYPGSWDEIPDIKQLSAAGSGVVPTADLACCPELNEDFGVRFTGLFFAEQSGLHTFFTTSDEGSRLRIAGQIVVDNDGLHPIKENAGLIRLSAGYHPVEIEYFEKTGDEVLEVLVEEPGKRKRIVPAERWFHSVQN